MKDPIGTTRTFGPEAVSRHGRKSSTARPDRAEIEKRILARDWDDGDGLDADELALYDRSVNPRHPGGWRQASIPPERFEFTIEDASADLDITFPYWLHWLYAEYGGSEHRFYGTLIHPSVLRAASDMPDMPPLIAPRLVVPVFNRMDDYLCLDFRPRHQDGPLAGSLVDLGRDAVPGDATGHPAVLLASLDGGRPPALIYPRSEEINLRMGYRMPA